MDLSELSNDELFDVLLCDKEPISGVTKKEYAAEWNKRCRNKTNKDGEGYVIDFRYDS